MGVPVWRKYCNKLSFADFMVLMSKFSIERSRGTKKGAPIKYAIGRKDSRDCNAGKGRLPDHQIGFSEFPRVFENQMKMTVKQGVTLTGAHTIGHVHTEYSKFGFSGDEHARIKNPKMNAWTEDPHVFEGHEYYTQMFDKPWLNIINLDFE